ncbi:hypothetical protein PWT90_09165 [Aphanocladium album]|nr:hypothetical protein PWT90_09165 [Aphanocladium album]
MDTEFRDVINSNVIAGNKFSGPTTITINAAKILTPSSHVEELSQSQRYKQCLDVCKNFFSSPDAAKTFRNTKGFASADWILQEEAFIKWQETCDPLKLLTIKAQPFTGKSVLMKRAVQHCLNNSKVITLYHFFHDPAPEAAATCFRAFISQLLDQVPEVPSEDLQRWAKVIGDKRHHEFSSVDTLLKAIVDILLANKDTLKSGVRIFVDAVEDCQETRLEGATSSDGHDSSQTPLELLKSLQNLSQSAHNTGIEIGIFVARRHLPEYGVLEPPTEQIDLQQYIAEEVPKFLREQLKKLDREEWDKYNLLRTLMKTGSHNFLWATVKSEKILENVGADNYDELVELASEVLDDHVALYRSALSQLKASKDSSRLAQLLKVGLGTFRPLTADEFRHGLAFMDESGFKRKNMADWEKSSQGRSAAVFKNYIQRASGGLLSTIPRIKGSVDDYERWGDDEDTAEEHHVLFIHRSAEIFLRSQSGYEELCIASEASLEQACHLQLFHICKSVLEHCGLRGRDDVKILRYALEFWLRHARECGNLLDHVALPDFLRSCSDRKGQRFVEQHMDIIFDSQSLEALLLDDGEGLMVLLSTMGCTSMLRKHVESCKTCQQTVAAENPSADDEETFRRRRNSLNNAIVGGYADTIQYLLEICQPNDMNLLCDGRTILYDACYFAISQKGPKKEEMMGVVRTLMDLGADPCVRSLRLYEYVLQMAIQLGDEDMLRELLRDKERAPKLFRAKMKAKGWTALHFTIKSQWQNTTEQLHILKLVLELAPKSSGLLQVPDNDGKTPLDLAEEMGDDHGDDMLEALERFAEEDEEEEEI